MTCIYFIAGIMFNLCGDGYAPAAPAYVPPPSIYDQSAETLNQLLIARTLNAPYQTSPNLFPLR